MAEEAEWVSLSILVCGVLGSQVKQVREDSLVLEASGSIKRWVVLRCAASWEALPDDLGLASGMVLSFAHSYPLSAAAGGSVHAVWTPLSSPERVINSVHNPATEQEEQRSDEEFKKSNFGIIPETSASMHLLNETR